MVSVIMCSEYKADTFLCSSNQVTNDVSVQTTTCVHIDQLVKMGMYVCGITCEVGAQVRPVKHATILLLLLHH